MPRHAPSDVAVVNLRLSLFFVLALFTSTTLLLLSLTVPAARAETSQPPTSPPPPSAASATAPQSFFNWTDTSITILPYGWNFRVDPSRQTTLTFEHAHDSAIGDFFGFVDLIWFHNAPDGSSSFNWYGELHPRLSVGKLLQKDLSFTLFERSVFEFKDVLFAMQYERGRNPGVAEAVLIGMGIDLDVRRLGLLGRLGKFKYLQINFYARAELTEGTKKGFRDMQITLAAAYPFEIAGARFLIDGYFDWVLGIGSEVSSFHLNPQIKLDVGHLIWKAPEKFYAGVELDFWTNKYQIRSTPAFGTNQFAVSLLLKYHF